MARTNRKEVEERERAAESASHKKRRQNKERFHEVIRARNWDEEEFENFEPRKRRKR